MQCGSVASVQCGNNKMSMKINPPDLSKCKTYERYKLELKAWQKITDIPKKKQGIAIALSLPEDGNNTSGIREKVFEEVDLDALETDTGLDTLITFFDKHLAKDDLADTYEKFEDFEDFERKQELPITEYIQNYDQKYNRLVKLKIVLPPAILAFKLLKRASLTPDQRMLVLTGMDFKQKENLYEQAKTSLRKFLGDGRSTKNASVAVKLEPAFLAEHEEALAAAGYVRKYPRTGNNSVWRGNGRGTTWNRQKSSAFANARGVKRINPSGSDGRPLLCKSCGSFRHLLADCPDSYENMPAKVNVAEDDEFTYAFEQNFSMDDEYRSTEMGSENVVLFANEAYLSQLSVEARNCAVLDSGCSSTVCGKQWLKCYIQSLSTDQKEQISEIRTDKTFKFGGGEVLKLRCRMGPVY